MPVSYHDHEVLKIDDLKFFECPLSAITAGSWRLLQLVTDTLNGDGEYLNLSHLPRLRETIAGIEGKYRAAVRIVKQERGSEWFSERRERYLKERVNHG